MNRRLRTALLLGSLFVAWLFAWLFAWPPIATLLVPEPTPEEYLRFEARWRVAGFAMFFVLLAPVWLPAAVPTRFRRTAAAVQVTCGALLLAAAVGLVALMVAVGSVSLFAGTVALIAAVVGVLHIQRARLHGAGHAA